MTLKLMISPLLGIILMEGLWGDLVLVEIETSSGKSLSVSLSVRSDLNLSILFIPPELSSV